jgi:hypothetical protein
MKLTLQSRIFLALRSWLGQLLISTAVAITVAFVVRATGAREGVRELVSPTQAITILGVIGSIIALASSIAFGHLLQFLGATNEQKSEAYYRLHDRLYELDSLLRDEAQDDPLVWEAQRFSFELKKLRLQDYPVLDWDERMGPLLQLVTAADKRTSHLAQEVLIRLHHCEDLISTIGLMSIRQIVAGALVQPVIKSFALLAALMILGIATYFLAAIPSAQPVVAAVPTFFGTFSALLFIEVGWLVYRETEEILDFVEREELEPGTPRRKRLRRRRREGRT